MRKPTARITPEQKAEAKRLRKQLASRPAVEQVVTPAELADASPLYFTLRTFVAELKAARVERGWTLADVADRTGLAVETLSRLETGAIVNPTWQTLTRYAVAVGRRVRRLLEPADVSD